MVTQSTYNYTQAQAVCLWEGAGAMYRFTANLALTAVGAMYRFTAKLALKAAEQCTGLPPT